MGAQQRGRSDQHLLVTALADPTTPAKGLTAADFIVREDGLAREVIRVDAAPPPSHVLLLIDDSQASERSIQYLRSGLAGFITRLNALKPAPQFALMTFGERPTLRADFAPKADAVQAAAGQLFAVPGSGSYLLQAVMDACKSLSKRTAASPVIVAFVSEAGPEFSNEHRDEVSAALKAADAALWTSCCRPRPQDETSEARERAAVIGDVMTASGGITSTILSGQGLESAFDTVAGLMASRYLVTYCRPEPLVPPTADRGRVETHGVRVVDPRAEVGRPMMRRGPRGRPAGVVLAATLGRRRRRATGISRRHGHGAADGDRHGRRGSPRGGLEREASSVSEDGVLQEIAPSPPCRSQSRCRC